MIDEKRLFFIVGDVCGKGLPASLFMVMSKVLTKSTAMRGGLDIRSIIGEVNVELSRENPEMLFITVFAAILHTESGRIEYCIAGHEAPWLFGHNGEVRQLSGEGNPPLCVVEDFDYPLESVQLSPGDAICVLTDGITDAMNMGGEMYGKKRVPEMLGHKVTTHPVALIASRLHDDVKAFIGDAEQYDDITLLIVRWLVEDNK